MNKLVPTAVGVVLVLIGLVWASQGAGLVGGSSLMDHNITFVYLGGMVAAVGLALLAVGAVSKPSARTSAVDIPKRP